MGVPDKNFHCKGGGGKTGWPSLATPFCPGCWSSTDNPKQGDGSGYPPITAILSYPDFPVVQYADDTLIVMQACAKQLFYLKGILNTFADSNGWRVNFHKSLMIPINVPSTKMEIFSRTFGCQQGSLPFTYLGLPLGISKPKIMDYFLLIQHVERRLASCASFYLSGED